jgi:hypothetical protein
VNVERTGDRAALNSLKFLQFVTGAVAPRTSR